MAGTKKEEYCAQHAPDAMTDVIHRKCRTESCGKRPLFGVVSSKTVRYCVLHAPEEGVNVKHRLLA